jgi:hypothetical protein
MSSSLTSKQEQAISEVEKALKKLYENGLVMITENGNALFYTKEQYKDSVKIVEIFNNKRCNKGQLWQG